jgi:NAD(P)-dependent dehydrogenase (short-subunit alcohol dehydrogenase family)
MVQNIETNDKVRSVVGRFADLAGKRALVTGGSAGIGRAVALGLSDNGAIVTVLARRKDRLDAVVKELPQGHGVVADLYKIDEVEAGVKEAIQKMGGLDILVNNGAVNVPEMTGDNAETYQGYEAGFRLHVSATYAAIKAAEAELIRNKGVVINVSSGVAIAAAPGPAMAPYFVAKAAQDVLTRNLARQYAPQSVRVIGVNPAWVKTEATTMMSTLLQKPEDEIVAAAGALHALGRISTADEQAAVIVFLASAGAGFITGNNILVDGGWSVMLDAIPSFP